MRDLIALEDYVASLGSGLRRSSIVSGLVFGLSMGAFCLLALWPTSGPAKALSIATLGGVATGLAFGFMFPRNLKKKLQHFARSVFQGEGRYAAPPPAGAWEARVPCNRMAGSIGIGGLLYLQPGGFAFVPHSVNLPRHRQIVISTGEPLATKLVNFQGNRWQRLLVPQPPPLLEISSPSDSWRFVVPKPEEILPGIERELFPRAARL
jgi:hypothetical protein